MKNRKNHWGITSSGWGGRREGAGRKPKGEKAGVPHDERASFTPGSPIHVRLQVQRGLPSLRSARAMRVMRRCLGDAREHLGLRITQFSIQRDHIHLIIEADDRASLSRGMKGLSVRIARGLNAVTGRRGPVFEDRFRAQVLRTPLETRDAVELVRRCGRVYDGSSDAVIDPFGGGPCPRRFPPSARRLVSAPRSTLLRQAWGLPVDEDFIDLSQIPWERFIGAA